MTIRNTLMLAGALFALAACNDKPADTAPADQPAAAKTEPASSIPCPFAANKDWAGWVDGMPGPDAKRTLIVTGEVEVGTDGYEGKLTLGALDKKLPPNQHVELTLVEKAGAKKGWQPVRLDEPATAPEYDSLIVDCHGETLATIHPVEEVEKK